MLHPTQRESIRHSTQIAKVSFAPLVTPLIHCKELSRRTDRNVFAKCEFLQTSGSFKYRGALAVAAREVGRGCTTLVASSTGNFGIGLAAAAPSLGARAVIFVPSTIPPRKLEVLEALGAEVHQCSPTRTSTSGPSNPQEMARRYAQAHNLPLVSPYDDPAIIEANVALFLEADLQLRALRSGPCHLAVPVGGGSLLAAAAIASVQHRFRGLAVGVEPRGHTDFCRSLSSVVSRRNGYRARPTICDALTAMEPGKLPLRVVRRYLARVRIHAATDNEVLHWKRILDSDLNSRVEPSSAAAACGIRFAEPGETVIVVATGGNT